MSVAIKQLKKMREILSKHAESSEHAAMVLDAIDESLAEHDAGLDADSIPTLDDIEELPDAA